MQELLPEVPLGSDGHPAYNSAQSYAAKTVSLLVDMYGSELVLAMKHPASVAGIVEPIISRGYDRVPEMLLWHDEILAINNGDYLVTLSERREMFLAGVSPETVATGLAFGRSARQILATHEGVAKPVSEGWL